MSAHRGLITLLGRSAGGGGGGTGFYRDFTLDHTKAGASDSSDFPLLIDYTDATLKSVAHGGHVQRSDGFDILPYLDTGMSSLAKFERELYDPTTGHIILHAKMPTVSHTSDILLTRLQYGDSSITTDHADIPNVWTNSFARVVHMGDGSTLSGADSVAGNNFTITSATATAGQIDGAASFGGGTQYLKNAAAAASGVPLTFSAWVKLNTGTSAGVDQVIASIANTGAITEIWFGYYNNGGTPKLRVMEQLAGSPRDTQATVSGDTNWHLCHGVLVSDSSHIIYQDGSALSGSAAGSVFGMRTM